MSVYRNNLPQLSDRIFITDAGIETELLYKHGFELPCFAAFTATDEPYGYEIIEQYYTAYAKLAREFSLGLILESYTWRASYGWGDQLHHDPDQIDEYNIEAIEMLLKIRNRYESDTSPMPISGCIGPRGDGYSPDAVMTENEAETYHYQQIRTLAATDVDLVSAYTINTITEALGITRAARSLEVPVVISYTVETDGRLPSGPTLQEAIETLDAKTNSTPVYYMINCAHPTHFADTLDTSEPWIKRIRGVRANASCMSHAELDCCDELDAGNPTELGKQLSELHSRHPHINILGGCCGTGEEHIRQIAKASGMSVQV